MFYFYFIFQFDLLNILDNLTNIFLPLSYLIHLTSKQLIFYHSFANLLSHSSFDLLLCCCMSLFTTSFTLLHPLYYRQIYSVGTPHNPSSSILSALLIPHSITHFPFFNSLVILLIMFSYTPKEAP